MQKWINFLQGSVEVEVTGAFPERFLNLCAQEWIGFWNLSQPDAHTFRMRIAYRDLGKLEPLAQRIQCEIKVCKRSGVPSFLAGFRRRYALFLGFAMALCVVSVLSKIILIVEVQGNEIVPTAAILGEMKRLGVRPGAYGPEIDENQVCNEALLTLKDLTWISVNLHGTRAEVLVKEKEQKPEIVDEKIPAHVVADGSGIIVRQDVLNGQACFREGDTVIEGEILISGIVDIPEPEYSQVDLGTLTVHAAGEIYAQTWRTLTAVIPQEVDVKEYTGNETSRWSLIFFDHRLQFYKNGGISYERYDKITNNYTLRLPGGQDMPLSLVRETMREYNVNPMPIQEQAGEALLQTRLEERLNDLMQRKDGKVLKAEYSTARRNGLLVGTLLAECREEIGQTVLFEGEVGREMPGRES